MSAAVAVVPAAGASRRMGRDKLLLPLGDTVVVGAVLEALENGGVERVVVVTAPGNLALRQWVERAGQEVAINPAPERGMLSSVWEGLSALGGVGEVAARRVPLLVTPGDLPGIDRHTVRALIELVALRADIAVPVHDGGRGHPLAISPRLVDEIPGLDLEVGLRQLLTRHRDGIVELEVAHPGVLRDVDTPDDYDAALKERQGTDRKRR